jgi:DNA-binding IclR family transcriptional regulator
MNLLEALGAPADAPAQPDGWYTTADLRRLLGLSEGETYRRLHALQDAGRLEVGQAPRVTLTGVVRRAPAYRLRDEKTPGS